MDVGEFEDCLDRFGAEIARWPDSQRSAGEALLAVSSEARDLLKEAIVLQRALAAPSIRAPTGLADRIVLQAIESTPVTRVQPPVTVEKPSLWTRLADIFPLALQPSSAFVLPVCFIIGILVGFFSSSETVDGTHLDLPSYVAHVVDTAHDAD